MKKPVTFILLYFCFMNCVSCDEPAGKKGEPIITMDLSELQSSTRDLDIIFLIDSSASMADEQALLQQSIQSFIRVFRDSPGGMPNLHIGVITPDLGTAPFDLPGCSLGGDAGRFLKGVDDSCDNPINQKYIVDIEPRGCQINKNFNYDGSQYTCTHSCAPHDCDETAFMDVSGIATEPAGLILAIDEQGCPRCRNYQNETLEQVFQCISDTGTDGCGMEQPLEAIRRSVTDSSGSNSGFLRYSANLAIFMISDEDDCSVKDPILFNPEGDINSTLGILSSFRCTEFGVVCDQPWQRVMPQGLLSYSNCRPRESDDPENLLFSVSSYVDALSTLKDDGNIFVGAIAGPYADQLTVGMYDQNPKLQPSCGSTDDGGDPAVRISTFVSAFLKEEADMQWALTSICSYEYSPSLVGFADAVVSSTYTNCMPYPVEGCPDPSFANGEVKLTDLPDDVALVCAPICEVQDIDFDGNISEIPLCMDDYANGHPANRDPNMPVRKCYHVGYREDCAIACPPGSNDLGCHPTNNPWFAPSRGADIIISRREEPTIGTTTKVVCQAGKLNEDLCFDGLDNDVDGNYDIMDPDCEYQLSFK